MDFNERFALLTHVPLLTGLGSRELAQLDAFFDIDEFPPMDAPIIRQGDPCSQLLFLIKGKMKRSFQSPDASFTVHQVVESPQVIEPESIYSLNGVYRSGYQFVDKSLVISIRRGDVTQRMMKLEIFRINYVNLLASKIQQRLNTSFPPRPSSIEEKFWHFVHQVFEPPIRGVLDIKMSVLAEYLSETRLNVSTMLRRLESARRLNLSRGRIELLNTPSIY
ncbi:MAG: Crp/Fnr family transcriptional regulator [Bacteroidaceae bacterium]|nr:Crp/Fnr family transcriptional regulator [Bacteroidaceae bacterium]